VNLEASHDVDKTASWLSNSDPESVQIFSHLQNLTVVQLEAAKTSMDPRIHSVVKDKVTRFQDLETAMNHSTVALASIEPFSTKYLALLRWRK
jgi:hypothetical protein